MAISTTAATTPTATASATAASSAAGGTLGKDQFLRLLTTQLQHQDPMSPLDDMSFIGQMAQFSALEQTTNMAEALDRYGLSQQVAQSIGLLGHVVDADDPSGAPITGTVDSVAISNGSIAIDVAGTTVAPGAIKQVR
jgi:flagellar basal-body rod modification protein FlgD